MVVDCHTHVFPPQVAEGREELLRTEPTFGEMYGSPRARLATAPELLASMEGAGVDISFLLGFAWRRQELCRHHNDYLLEWGARSGGRLLPFCTVNPAAPGAWQEVERCARGGARGLGELRPESQGWDLLGPAGELLAEAARRLGLVLLFHVSEPVGHPYPGKEGLALTAFYRFAVANPDLTIVAAHLGGGLPFFAPMPEVREVCRRLYFDTAAVPLLYGPEAYALVDDDRLLFGSDYPLLSQERALASLPDPSLARRWSQNALALLGCGRG
jgi:predicted TIM-barrel fold metal-dependent hydrolase